MQVNKAHRNSQVIGTHSERVSFCLEKAGIDCIVHGDEFHEILVPEHNKQEAIALLEKDAKETGYEIIWSTP